MNARPTPEQIADGSAPADVHSRRNFLDVLAHHGYTIIHWTDEQQRARDEAIIRATCDQLGVVVAYPMDNRGWFDDIIAAAEEQTP